jgi:hypothetical protein
MAKGWWVVSLPLKTALDGLLCILNGDEAAAIHHMDALTEVLRRIRRNGGGVGTIKLSLGGTAGQRMVPHSPVILVEEIVQRRKPDA